MSFKYAYTLPIICVVWFVFTFITTYAISVLKKDVTAVFPYISDTGTWSPESCIFGLMLNIGAVIQAAIIYIRYRQVIFLLEKETSISSSAKKYNWKCLLLGTSAAFGVCIVANFQETNAFAVHVFGAVLAFGLGSIYQCIQTRLSFQIYPFIGSKKVNIAKICCAGISSFMFMVTFSFAGLSLLQFTGDDRTKWTKNDGGYLNHFISVVAEWILVFATMLYLLLFTDEFKEIAFSEPPLSERSKI